MNSGANETYRLAYLTQAVASLQQLLDYLWETFGETVEAQVRAQIERAVTGLKEFPDKGFGAEKVAPELAGFRLLILNRYCVCVYSVDAAAKVVTVVEFADTRSDWLQNYLRRL